MIIHQLWYSPFHYKYLWGRHMVFLCPYSGVPWCLEKHPLRCFEQMQLQISPVMFKENAWIKSSINFTNLWFTSNMLSNSPFYIIPSFHLSWEASFVHISFKHLSGQTFIVTTDQVVGVVHTGTVNCKPTARDILHNDREGSTCDRSYQIKIMKNYFQSIIDLLDHPYAIILSICHPEDCHVFIHIILVSVNQREIFTLH